MRGSPELDEHLGSCDRPPEYATDTELGARVRTREARVRDAVLTDFRTTVRLRSGTTQRAADELRLYVVHRGSWTLQHSGSRLTLPGGRFTVRRSAGLTGFEMSPQTAGATIALPAGAIGGPRATSRSAARPSHPKYASCWPTRACSTTRSTNSPTTASKQPETHWSS